MTSSAHHAYTRDLATFAAEIEASQISPELAHEMGRVLLDCTGCAVAGLTTPLGRVVAELARDEHGRLEATALGVGPASLLPAVFANVSLANALEFEVQGPEGHVCAVAAPVALAVAEALDASGAELVAGLVAGLEVAGRIGASLRGPARTAGAAGGHAHVVFAAAAAAGHLLRLTPDQMHHALGIAGYSATIRTTERYQGSHKPLMIKNSLGTMAQYGTQAALLAQRGFTGDLEVLEGDLGFWRFSYAVGCDWEQLTGDLGHRWVAGDVAYKPVPSALNLVSTTQLLRRMAQEYDLAADRIERVEVRSPRQPEPPWPAGAMNPTNFWHHQRYICAAALAGVRPARSWPDPATYDRPEVRALMDAIHFAPLRDGEVGTTGRAYADGWSPVRATVQTDRRTLEGAQDYRLPMTDDEVRTKFHENVAGLLAPADARAIVSYCRDLRALDRARALSPHLQPGRS